MLDLIERKAQGETIVIEEPTEEPEQVPDLMAALEASIAGAKSPSKAKPKPQEARAGQEEGSREDVVPAAARVEVEVEGRRLSLSNLDKVLYPAVGFTKGQVIDYYTRVAPVLLPHLRDRPLTLKRYPNGVEGQYFYEKRCPSHAPEWVRRERGRRRSSTASATTCRRSSGSPTWPTWSCTRRCRRSTRSCARP